MSPITFSTHLLLMNKYFAINAGNFKITFIELFGGISYCYFSVRLSKFFSYILQLSAENCCVYLFIMISLKNVSCCLLQHQRFLRVPVLWMLLVQPKLSQEEGNASCRRIIFQVRSHHHRVLLQQELLLQQLLLYHHHQQKKRKL